MNVIFTKWIGYVDCTENLESYGDVSETQQTQCMVDFFPLSEKKMEGTEQVVMESPKQKR